MNSWTQLHIPANWSGHRLWQHPDGRIAVTDYSLKEMGNPASTKDGLLLLDRTRPITSTEVQYGDELIAKIPLTDAQGRKVFTPAVGTPVEFCIAKLGMQDQRQQLQRRR